MAELSFIQNIAAMALPLLFGVTFHEVAQGYAALYCGDKTAQRCGRLSFNPLRHIDLIGTIILPILCLMLGGMLFGWARPIPIDSRHFKQWRRDTIIVSLAGPMANFALAIAFALVLKLGVFLSAHPSGASYALQIMGEYGIILNLFLMIFNLIPIPPLNGGRILLVLLPPKLAFHYRRIEAYAMWVVLLLLILGVGRALLIPVQFLRTFILQLVGL